MSRPDPPRTWYHGRSLNDPPWQHDPAHPGVWLASRRNAARWYAGDDGQVLQVRLHPGTPTLDLRDPATFRRLVAAAGLTGTPGLRRAHNRGSLYMVHEGDAQNRLVAAAFAQGQGLIMRDNTAGVSHLSLVVPSAERLTLQGPPRPQRPRPARSSRPILGAFPARQESL